MEVGLKKYQVKIELHGKSYVITRVAEDYRNLVHSINKDFGNVMILETIDLN